MSRFKRCSTCSASSSFNEAAPESMVFIDDVSYSSTIGCLASATAIGGAMNAKLALWSWMISRKSPRSNLDMVYWVARRRSSRLSSAFMP